MIYQLVTEGLANIGRHVPQLRYAIDDVRNQMKAIETIADHHIERRRRRSFFYVATDMKVVVVGSTIGQSMD